MRDRSHHGQRPAICAAALLLCCLPRCQCVLGGYEVDYGDSGELPAGDAARAEAGTADRVSADSAGADTSREDARSSDANALEAGLLDAVSTDASERDRTVMDSAAADGAAPDGTATDSEVIDVAELDASVFDAAGSDVLAADTLLPDMLPPDAAAPDLAQIDALEPDAVAPDVSAPDVVEDGCVPDCFQRCGGEDNGCGGSCDQACPPDECALGTDDCDPCGGLCADTWDGFDCSCRDGYAGDGHACTWQHDGSATVTGSVDLSTDALAAGRSCADGVSFSVVGLTLFQADLSATPAACCLDPGTQVLLINLQGSGGASDNVGHYELRTVGSVVDSTVYFNVAKQRWYGSGAGDDNDIGLGDGQQRVSIVRVPRYTALTVEAGAQLATAAWSGARGGVLALEVTGALLVAGAVDMSGLGYNGGNPYCSPSSGVRGWQGESIIGPGVNAGWEPDAQAAAAPNVGGGGGGCHVPDGRCEYSSQHGENRTRSFARPGGGAGYGEAGAAATSCSSYTGAACGLTSGTTCGDTCQYETSGGLIYGASDLREALLMGSGGGGGSARSSAGSCPGTSGGDGGGAILIWAGSIEVQGSVAADGVSRTPGYWAGGGGSGGSVFISSPDLTLGAGLVSARGGDSSNSGGAGRIALEPGVGTISGTTDPAAWVVP